MSGIKSLSILMLFALLMLGNRAFAATLWEKVNEYEAKQEYTKAINALIPAIRYSSKESKQYALFKTAKLQYNQRNHSEAIKTYKEILAINSHAADALLAITYPLQDIKKWSSSIKYLKMLIKIDPLNYDAHIQFAKVYQAKKKWPLLKALSRRMMDYRPSKYQAFIFLARAENATGNFTAARNAYLEVLSRAPNNKEANKYLILNKNNSNPVTPL
jgi:tetratricopeptide (TPR) repeat protein